MFMTAIDIETADLSPQHAFYTQTFDLPLRQTTADAFTVQAGTTAQTFRSASQPPLLYHFAFTIPIITWKQAKVWLISRTMLLEGEGEDEFESERVRTRSYSFPDPAGNILEFIARQDLPARAGADFGAEDVLHISELGMVVDDVPGIVKHQQTRLGVEVFRDSSFENFAKLGDINGVLVLTKRGRLWFPDQRQPAAVSPVRVSIWACLPNRSASIPIPMCLKCGR